MFYKKSLIIAGVVSILLGGNLVAMDHSQAGSSAGPLVPAAVCDISITIKTIDGRQIILDSVEQERLGSVLLSGIQEELGDQCKEGVPMTGCQYATKNVFDLIVELLHSSSAERIRILQSKTVEDLKVLFYVFYYLNCDAWCDLVDNAMGPKVTSIEFLCGYLGEQILPGSCNNRLKMFVSSNLNLISPQCLQILTGHTAAVNCMTLTQDGRLITGSMDGVIRIWNLQAGECLKTLTGHTDIVNCMTLTQNGRLITGSRDNAIRVWNLTTGECLRILAGHTNPVICMILTPDGRLMSGSDDSTMRVWNLQTGECLRILTDIRDIIKCMTLTPDGRFITGSYDHTIRVWNLQTGECLRILTDHTTLVECMALTPDDRLIIGFLDYTIRAWNLKTGECLKILRGYTNPAICMTLTPDGRLITCFRNDNMIRIWGSPIPEINTLSVEQLLLVLKIANNCIDASQLGDLRMQELYDSLPEATRYVIASRASNVARRLSGKRSCSVM